MYIYIYLHVYVYMYVFLSRKSCRTFSSSTGGLRTTNYGIPLARKISQKSPARAVCLHTFGVLLAETCHRPPAILLPAKIMRHKTPESFWLSLVWSLFGAGGLWLGAHDLNLSQGASRQQKARVEIVLQWISIVWAPAPTLAFAISTVRPSSFGGVFAKCP